MTSDFSNTRATLEQLRAKSVAFFDGIKHLREDDDYYRTLEADYYWLKLDEIERQTSNDIQSELIQIVGVIANGMRQSSLLTEADRRELGTLTKSLRASLRLRRYDSWDAELLHDEGIVMGIQQAGQSETVPADPDRAAHNFARDVSNLIRLVDLVEVSPTLLADEFRSNPQATTEFEPDSAFVMMQIDPKKPELVDRYNAIKECFKSFGIKAIRADEIEHEDVITEKIMEKIKTSEFLIADLTGERPSVYYEIGYAHALKRRVIMYRKTGTQLHFDLAAYNCPTYENVTQLKELLTNRLSHMTNKGAKK